MVVRGQQSVVPYGSSVTTQGFLDMISIMPMMFIMFFFVMMMGLMRSFVEHPEEARKTVGEAVTYIPVVGPTAGKAIKGE